MPAWLDVDGKASKMFGHPRQHLRVLPETNVHLEPLGEGRVTIDYTGKVPELRDELTVLL